jgi:hypothetical protein
MNLRKTRKDNGETAMKVDVGKERMHRTLV